MSVENFIPEIWNAAIAEPFDKNLVYGQKNVASSAWMGEITGVGDTVHISHVEAPTIRDYHKGEAVEVEDINTTRTTLEIDQGDYFAFRVHDVDTAQAAGDFRGPAMKAAAIELRDGVDQHLASLLRDGAHDDNRLGVVEVVNDDPKKAGPGQITGFKLLTRLRAKLDAQSVPTEGRYVVVGPTFYSALLMDPRFTQADTSGTTAGLRNGEVGKAVGFDVLVSNNVPTTAGRELVIAGTPEAFALANQLVETEAIRDGDHFGDVVRGLNVYGAAVTRPEGIATADVDIIPAA